MKMREEVVVAYRGENIYVQQKSLEDKEKWGNTKKKLG